MTRFQAETAALDEHWQGRTIAVMLPSNQASDHGASAPAVQFHRHVLNCLRQGPRGPPAPLPAVAEHVADYELCVDAWATRIAPPAAFDADLACFDLPIFGARSITVGKRCVAAAEIGVCAAGRSRRVYQRGGVLPTFEAMRLSRHRPRQCALPRRRHSRRGTRQRDVWAPPDWQEGRNPGLARICPARVSAPRLYPKSFRLRYRSAGPRLAAARCDRALQDHKTGAVFTNRALHVFANMIASIYEMRRTAVYRPAALRIDC
jgi:hypothetical protein